jgi:hypothetical protein
MMSQSLEQIVRRRDAMLTRGPPHNPFCLFICWFSSHLSMEQSPIYSLQHCLPRATIQVHGFTLGYITQEMHCTGASTIITVRYSAWHASLLFSSLLFSSLLFSSLLFSSLLFTSLHSSLPLSPLLISYV